MTQPHLQYLFSRFLGAQRAGLRHSAENIQHKKNNDPKLVIWDKIIEMIQGSMEVQELPECPPVYTDNDGTDSSVGNFCSQSVGGFTLPK
ncbi:hypothetical protein BGZ65_008416, partial [Modicella reniformis]